MYFIETLMKGSQVIIIWLGVLGFRQKHTGIKGISTDEVALYCKHT